MARFNMNYDDEWSSDDDDENQASVEDEESGRKFLNRKTAIIYLLDSRKQMFLQDNLIDEKIPFTQCLKCIRNAIRGKIFTSEKSLCAFIMIGTKKTDNPLNLKSILIVQRLKLLSAEHVLKIDDIQKMIDNSSYDVEYGSAEFSLADAFWLCSKLFNECSKNMKLVKTIMLFTNNDNPTNNDRNELDRIINCAKDMVENEIVFNLIHLGEKFNVNNMYKELIQLSRNDLDYEIPKPALTVTDIMDRITKIDHTHVSFANIPFLITDKFECEVSVYYFTRKIKPPFKLKLSKATNDIVTTKTQFFETDTGEVVSKNKLVKSYNLGGKEIIFTMEEMQHIEKFSERGLRLMGFKPASTVNLEHFVKPCAFIYPRNPNDTEGTVFFVALLKRCLDRQVVPICTFCSRSGASLEYVALIATEEETAADNTQIIPSGFLVFFLPFADDVRDLDEKCTGKKRASATQVNLAMKLIEKLKFSYRPELFPNPKLASHWSAVEALALNLKEPEPFPDATIPPRQLKKITEEEAKDLRDAIYTEDYDPECSASRVRAKPVKISKAPESGLTVDANLVESALRSGEVNKLTNDMLKLFLQQVGEGKGLSKTKKSELVAKACKFLNIPVPLS